MPCFIVCFGGELQIAHDSTPTYIGGRNRHIEVDGNITLEEFKRRLVRVLHLDHITHNVNITCRLRENGGYIATPITDEEIFEFILSEAMERHVVLYVEPEEIRTADEIGAEFIELTFPETGTSSQIYRPTPVSGDDITTIRRYSVSDIAATQVQHDIRRRASISERPLPLPLFRPYVHPPVVPEDDENYQTMDSGTSDDSTEDGVELEPNVSLPNEDFADVPGHEQIRSHAIQNQDSLDLMATNNDFVQMITSTEEWDRTNNVDGPTITITGLNNAIIPTEFYVGLLFQSKEALQFAISA